MNRYNKNPSLRGVPLGATWQSSRTKYAEGAYLLVMSACAQSINWIATRLKAARNDAQIQRLVTLPISILMLFFAYTAYSQDEPMAKMNESDNQVVIYTKHGCPYCERAVDFLQQKDVRYKKIDVGADQEQWDKLKDQTGSHTVPYIFINGQYIGGCSDMLALDESGKLQELFK